jgi:hypothetical protein
MARSYFSSRSICFSSFELPLIAIGLMYTPLHTRIECSEIRSLLLEKIEWGWGMGILRQSKQRGKEKSYFILVYFYYEKKIDFSFFPLVFSLLMLSEIEMRLIKSHAF